MEDMKDIDIYELLDIPSSADDRLIKKAYRKKALKCHPDKNPDNPNAAVLFLELSKALEVLLDQVKRAAYDKLYNAKKAAKIRHQELDSRRKKFKEDLEFKERLAQSWNDRSRKQEQSLAEKIERLRKEGSQQLREEMESVRQQIFNENLLKTQCNEIDDDEDHFRLKIRWKSEKDDPSNGGYNTKNLTGIFSKYGSVADLIVSQKKKGSGLIVFENSEAALKAYQLERGYPQNPLKLNWLDEAQAPTNRSGVANYNITSTNIPNFSNYNSSPNLFPSADNTFCTSNKKSSENLSASIDGDFEALVFAKLREAEEKKKEMTSTKT